MLSLRIKLTVILVCLFGGIATTQAATLKVNPNTGVYTVGKQFTISVSLNTDGKSVNAADGILTFNPKELQVISASRGNSIFNLWTEEPTFSNGAGTISFGGGSPTGYKGTSGTVMQVSFKALGAGTPKVNFKSGSVLAADGLGTNILTGMSGATFTIAAESDAPAPEYIPPANTPQAPSITSKTHPDQNVWYTEKTAQFTWSVPSGVTSIRMLHDTNPGTVPTVVYESPVSEKNIEDLPEGISYFHIQFKNADGWGRITHYKLQVDTLAPQKFEIKESASSTTGKGPVTLEFVLDDVSPVLEYKIKIDAEEPVIFNDERLEKKYTLKPLTPGYHTVSVEAFDSSRNSSVATYALTIESIEKPTFTEVPTRVNTGVVFALKGKTVSNATVYLEARNITTGNLIGEGNSNSLKLQADKDGNFTYIPDGAFERGVYVFTASAQDEFGRMSEKSDEVRIIVEDPNYIVFGSFVISFLSVLVPLVSIVLVLIFGSWYLWHKLSRWRKRVLKETLEAEESLKKEFHVIIKNLDANVEALKSFRKGKLTKQETDLIDQMENDVKNALRKIGKEIEDIEEVIT